MADSVKELKAAVDLGEDPTSFLVRIKELCPDIVSLFNHKQARLLSVDPTAPYDSKNVNEEYMAEVGAMYGLKCLYQSGLTSARSAVMKPLAKTKELNVGDFTIKKEVVDQV